MAPKDTDRPAFEPEALKIVREEMPPNMGVYFDDLPITVEMARYGVEAAKEIATQYPTITHS